MTPEITSPADLLSFSHVRNTKRLDTSRIGALKTASSRPQGIRATVDEQIMAWNGDNASSNSRISESSQSIGRAGIGLPMSNIFAT